MRSLIAILLLFALAVAPAAGAERINQEGRILGPAPVVTMPTLFDTAAADAIVSAMQIFPLDNAWNEDVSALPLLSRPRGLRLAGADSRDLSGDHGCLRLLPCDRRHRP